VVNEIAEMTRQINDWAYIFRSKEFEDSIVFARILDMIAKSCPYTVKNLIWIGV